MEKLSPEVLFVLIDHLIEPSTDPFDPLAPRPQWLRSHGLQRVSPTHNKPRYSSYATVCRKWQAIVETRNMSSIRISSRELGEFEAVFKNPRRRALLKRLDYTIALARNNQNECEHCAAFEQEIMKLFDLIGAWEAEQPGSQQESVDPLKKQKSKSFGPLELHLDVIWVSVAGPIPCIALTMSPTFLTLSSAAKSLRPLPALKSIVAFTISCEHGVAPHPSAACALVAAMPCIRSLDLVLYDPVQPPYIHESRVDLAAGLLSTLRGVPKPVRLVIRGSKWESAISECYYKKPNRKHYGVDDLCEVLKQLGREGKLEELMLQRVLVPEELFRGSEEDTWPALQRFRLETGHMAFGGQSRYNTGYGEGPDPTLFNPLMEAAAGAMLRMPVLEYACIEVDWARFGRDIDTITQIQWCGTGVDFVQPPDNRETSPPEELAVRRCAVWMGSASSWLIPESVLRLWHQWMGHTGTVEVRVIPETCVDDDDD